MAHCLSLQTGMKPAFWAKGGEFVISVLIAEVTSDWISSTLQEYSVVLIRAEVIYGGSTSVLWEGRWGASWLYFLISIHPDSSEVNCS